MKRIRIHISSTKKVARISAIIALILVVMVAGVSALFPNGPVGYKRLFIDSHANTYSFGSDFEYGGYIFNIKASASQITPDLSDCSNLLEGGIFSPNADEFYSKQNHTNYEPKESCIARNDKLISDVNANNQNFTISYSIKNNSNNIAAIKDGWVTAYAANGSTLYNGGGDLTITPGNTVMGDISAVVNKIQFSNVGIKLPELAFQIVN